jgi:putative two-component system response regulator
MAAGFQSGLLSQQLLAQDIAEYAAAAADWPPAVGLLVPGGAAEAVALALASSIESKDRYTRGHCDRLSWYASELGRRLGLSEGEIEALRIGGIVHDIGKLAVPDSVLHKPAALDSAEWELVREHPILGEQMCAGVPALQPVLPIIRSHHERFDGGGYPDRLVGEEIPLLARIVQIVDIYDALTTARPYKPAWSTDRALRIIADEVSAGWWDGRVFREFRAMIARGELAPASPAIM